MKYVKLTIQIWRAAALVGAIFALGTAKYHSAYGLLLFSFVLTQILKEFKDEC